MSAGTPATLLASLGVAIASANALALDINPNPSSADITSALVPSPGSFASIVATLTQGDPEQVGTYTGFTAPPVTIGPGIVMSTGRAVEAAGPYRTDVDNGEVSNSFGGASTPQIDAYAPGHIDSWTSSHDAAVVQVDFTLASSSAVRFNFIFGSVEYPVFTSSYTDAFLVFLNGSQITLDANANPVQVGTSFASSLRIDDANTIFTGVGAAGNDAHGLIGPLTTLSATLPAGEHSLQFQIADTNDDLLDSAVFINGFGIATNPGGPVTQPLPVPEPSTYVLMALGLGFVVLAGRRQARRRGVPA